MDGDNEQFGLISTDAPEEVVTTLFKEYWKNADDLDVDNFADLVSSKGYKAERTYTTEIYPK
jgi:hypothetical protein